MRFWFGKFASDNVASSSGRGLSGRTVRLWSAETGGTQYVDLLDRDGDAVTVATSGDGGRWAVQGPDDVRVAWADEGDDGDRVLVLGAESIVEAATDAAAAAASAAAAAASASAAEAAVGPLDTRLGTVEQALPDLATSAEVTVAVAAETSAREAALTAERAFGSSTYSPQVGFPVRTPPAGFDLTTLDLPTVYRIGPGVFATDLDVQALRPAAGVTYYVAPSGTSGAAGTSAGVPTTLPSALGKADVGTIVCADGEYFRNSHTAALITKSVNIVGGPNALLTGWELPSGLTWTLEAGAIYKVTRASTNGVVDKRAAYADSDGDFAMYEKKADLASITAAGQWAIVGSTVYVWALGSANLVTDSSFMRLSIDTGSNVLHVAGPNTLYVQGVTVEGGGSLTRGVVGAQSVGGTGGVPRLVLQDVTVRYAGTGNGLTLTGAAWGVFVRTLTTQTRLDGMNYHSGTLSAVTYVPDVVEIDCTTRKSGIGAGTETHNGSTAHDGVRAVRVNGDYSGSFGPVVADDSGAKTWNLGARAGGSTATAVRWWAFAVTGAASEQWLDECEVTSAPTALRAEGTSAIRTRDLRTGGLLGASTSTADSGAVTTY